MVIVALHTAATGLSALSSNIDIISNNLANVNTAGFKQSRANFEDLLYQEKQQPGVENGDAQRPAGLYVGLGTRISNTQLNFEQGSAINTGRELDLMIDGPGLFRVTMPDGRIGYTRAGNFFRNSEGELVLGNSKGPRVEPPITIPQDAISVAVSSNGQFQFAQPNNATSTAGPLTLATFINPSGLKSVGGNLYVETEASGPPIEGEPESGNFGGIVQSFLEASNVDPVQELVDLIKTQRAFEMNSQTIQAADETLQTISNLRRF